MRGKKEKEMIRNIVFDMGKVLVGYDPVAVCRQYTDSADEIELLRRELFASEEWTLLDWGMITEEEAMSRVKNRLPDQRMRDMADACMAHWHEYNIMPVAEMGDLVKELKEKGYGIYLCSNMSLRLRVFEDQLPGIQYFDGILVSAEEKLLKPDPAIYERLFEKFGLKAEECFFIDDLPANIEGAKKCGMDGYCFADGNIGKLREELKKRGIL